MDRAGDKRVGNLTLCRLCHPDTLAVTPYTVNPVQSYRRE